MTLAPGTQLGPYEVVSPLGAGGMGEVYRARDTRLGREVAIKTLPAAFARDPERRARFESEARAVAALSHPNVLAIHDVGAEGEITFAVMELVEGQTLRDRLIDGPLPAARAVAFAIQIAHGLAAAHDGGVIHRDLKPENVVLTPDGRAKILDFGLAKRVTPVAEGSGTMAPTVAVTEPGAVLGTSGYMAPEQVRGLPADARSDIFALGAVIHEMISGRRAFQAASPADTMSLILREDPPDLVQLVPDVPPAIERIVRRCLEKSPEARFRSAADLAYALEAVSTSGSHAARALDVAAARQPIFKRLTYRNGLVAGARFTPDGAGIVYGASWGGAPFEIFSSRPDSPEARSLGLPAGNLLSMSTTGEMALSIGYHHRFWNEVSGTLARASLAGGGMRLVQKDVGHADWSPDGRTMAIVRRAERRCRLEYPAGHLLFETTDWLSRPRVSRDGRRVAFAQHPIDGDSGGSICVVDDHGNRRVLVPDRTSISGLAWSPSGEEIWFSGINEELRNGIWAVREGGVPREIYTSPPRVTLLDIAPDGRVLMSLGNFRLGLNLSEDDGAREVDRSWFDGSVVTDFSSDGRSFLFWEGHEAENPHYATFIRDVDGSPAVRLGEGAGMALSPDGAWALAMHIRPTRDLVMHPTGLGESRPVPIEGLERIVWAGFHPDGRHLVLAGSAADGVRRLHLAPIEGGKPRLLWNEEIDLNRTIGLPVSPDGDRFVLKRAGGGHVVFSCRADSAEPLPQLGDDDAALRFDPTGRSLYVAGGAALDRHIDRLDLASGERAPWRTIRPPDPTGVVYVSHPVVAANGSRYAYSYFRHISDLYLVGGLA